MNGYNAMGKVETKQFLIGFYKEQYLMFTRLGIGGVTISGTEITEKFL